MTYCLGICVEDGLVFVSDSRTNAGPDHIRTYSKMHEFSGANRFLVLLNSGNLATTQGVVSQLENEIKSNDPDSLLNKSNLDSAAEHVGEILVQQQNKHASKLNSDNSFVHEASFILGGQFLGEAPGLVQIYAEGNFIRQSESMPFLQIGEIKYGRPILDRIIKRSTSLQSALVCALVSMDSTIRCNATVGPPVEYLVYKGNTFGPTVRRSLDDDDEYLSELNRVWSERLKAAFESLPEVPGIDNIDTIPRINILTRRNL